MLSVSAIGNDDLASTFQQVASPVPAAIVDVLVTSLNYQQFDQLTPAQVPLLTLAQVASIPNDYWFNRMPAPVRAALNQPQVQVLNVAAVRINLLTPQQVSWLTTPQVQSLIHFDFQYLGAAQIPLLTIAQIAMIPDPGTFVPWSNAARAALTLPQVQALRVATVRLNLLTTQQVSWLTVQQVQSVDFFEFRYLSPTQIAWLTTSQIATIPDPGIFGQWTAAQRAALTIPQLQALAVETVRIEMLSSQQIASLTATQVQTLRHYDFRFLNPHQIPQLTAAQVATIPDAGAFFAWSAAARAALTAPQVQALNVSTITIDQLTSQQVGYLTAAQVRLLDHFQFKYLHPTQIPFLTPAQIASIADPGTFVPWSDAARAALTQPQIQALRVATVLINLLTPQQVSWLTSTQIRSLDHSQFRHLRWYQIPFLTTVQIASIPDAGSFVPWGDLSRAYLTASQVRALRVATVRIDLLTPQQVGWLTTTQLQSLDHSQFKYVNWYQVPLLTTAQIASIPDPGTFAPWTAIARAVLTQSQVQALRVATVRIDLLTPQQINWLTTAQIRSLAIYDIPLLSASQIPLLAPAQFAAMSNTAILSLLSDEKQAALTRSQLLALPLDVLSNYMRIEGSQMPPMNYTPVVETPAHGISSQMTAEREVILDLVPVEAATHVAIGSGNWTSPQIWSNGVVPGANARVVIAAGRTVRFDAYMTADIFTVRVDGTLTFATNVNTLLRADTVIVSPTGALHIGTQNDPVHDDVDARILIAGNGPINTSWDPYLWSRGVVNLGELRVYGRVVTPYASLLVNPRAADTKLYLDQIPTGWRVGDEITIAGTNSSLTDFGTDRVQIRAIVGNILTIDPLQYSHEAPDGYGFSIQVANLNRNVRLVAEDPTVFQQRPHFALAHNPNVVIENIGVYGFGRTDKNLPINSPVVVNGVLTPGTGTNARARYAMHFHHMGVHPEMDPAIVRGSLVSGSPGWGFVNHSSNVVMQNNVAFNVVGSGFVSEDGNEIGLMMDNLSMNASGSGDFILSRKDIHDFGHGGHGFWFQGPGITVINNISAANRGGAYVYFPSSSKTLFDAINLTNPSMAGGRLAVPVGAVPLKPFEGNVAYGSQQGLEIWFHQNFLTDGETLIKDFKAWNIQMFGVNLQYTGQVTIRNSTLIGNQSFSGLGIMTNRLTHNLTIDNLRAEGFHIGIQAAARRDTTILGGYLANTQNILIEKGQDTTRTVSVRGVTFVKPSASQLNGRQYYEVFADGQFDFGNFLDRKVESLLSTDRIMIGPIFGPTARMLYYEQAPSYVPFPLATSFGYVPNSYLNKTNQQLLAEFGVAFGGELNTGGLQLPGYFGLVRSR